MPGELDPKSFDDFLRRALDEDVGSGDVTCEAAVPGSSRGEGVFVCKQDGIVAGIALSMRLFSLLEPDAKVEVFVKEGSRVRTGQRVATVTASARTVLAGERTALNLMQHLSGIATATHEYAKRVEGTGARVYDTRKTLPGLRVLEKYAVRMGGGANHRMGLWDMALLKENHFAAAGAGDGTFEEPARDFGSLVRSVVAKLPSGVPLEVEARTLEEALDAVAAGASLVMLDNFSPEETRRAVVALREAAGNRSVEIESSGGIRLETVRPYAEAGVDRIAIGALTHSSPALDIALYFRRVS